jgi:hypothetical protein
MKSTSQLRPFRDECYEAPVVCPQELPHHEQSEELRLRIVVA